MQFERNSKISLIVFAAVLLCTIFAGATNAASEIYYNTDAEGFYAPGNGSEIIDYGTTSEGGKVTQFTFGYAADHYGIRSATVRFYQGTYYYSTGRSNLLATFNISVQVASTSYWYTKTHSIPANEQFNLPSGKFGYSLEFNDDEFYVILAEGGTGNENYVWLYFYDLFWDTTYFSSSGNPNAGIYMSILADPLAEPTKVSGYKFDDADGDGEWDGGEDVLQGWRIYIDENENGQFDITEPNDITDPNGYYEFLNLPTPDTITIAEEMQEGWTQTLPGGAGTYQLSIVANGQYTNKNFGNTIQVGIPGDIVYPYGVGIEDFSVISANWQLTTSIGDIAPLPSGDGIVDELDLLLMIEYWLTGR